MQLRRKSLDHPDETRSVERARVELVELGEAAIGRAVFEPGWRWSVHAKPIVQTEWCEVHHMGYALSGILRVEMTDGATMDIRPGDAFEVPPGHDAWVVGDEPWRSIDFAGRRLFLKPPSEVAERRFATVVFTDLSHSTETVARLGDSAWRSLLADHNQMVRAALEKHGGREIQTTGDGFLVLFDSPASAVRGAVAMLGAASSHGLIARAGVHAGEVELHGEDVRGIAVHLAARILSVAEPGQIVVSATVRDLLAGSDLAFTDLGEFELRGIEGARRLSALDPKA